MGHSKQADAPVVDALGNPFRFELTGGEAYDSVHGFEMLKAMKLTMKQVLADRAYDTNAIRAFLEDKQAIPVIPGKKTVECLRNMIGISTKNVTW